MVLRTYTRYKQCRDAPCTALKISKATAGTIALPYAFKLSFRHLEKVIPSSSREIPSSPLHTGD